jgi:hypothetical protein
VAELVGVISNTQPPPHPCGHTLDVILKPNPEITPAA